MIWFIMGFLPHHNPYHLNKKMIWFIMDSNKRNASLIINNIISNNRHNVNFLQNLN